MVGKLTEIYDLIDYSDEELKAILRETLYGEREFDWTDLHEKICEIKGEKNPENIEFLYISNTGTEGYWVESGETEYETMIELNSLNERKCLIINNTLVIFDISDSSDKIYILKKPETIKTILTHFIEVMREVIDEYKERSNAFDDFFGEKTENINRDTKIEIGKIENELI